MISQLPMIKNPQIGGAASDKCPIAIVLGQLTEEPLPIFFLIGLITLATPFSIDRENDQPCPSDNRENFPERF